MKKLIVLMLVLGMTSWASALPIITGVDADSDGLLDLKVGAGVVTLTLEGTAAEASPDGSGVGGYDAWIWVDYASYNNFQTGAPSAFTSNVGGAASGFDTTSYMPAGGGFKFTAVADLTWTEASDVDTGAWFTFDVSMPGGANIGDTFVVDLLNPNFESLSSTTVEVVPEPVTIALLGLGGLFLRRRK